MDKSAKFETINNDLENFTLHQEKHHESSYEQVKNKKENNLFIDSDFADLSMELALFFKRLSIFFSISLNLDKMFISSSSFCLIAFFNVSISFSELFRGRWRKEKLFPNIQFWYKVKNLQGLGCRSLDLHSLSLQRKLLQVLVMWYFLQKAPNLQCPNMLYLQVEVISEMRCLSFWSSITRVTRSMFLWAARYLLFTFFTDLKKGLHCLAANC